MARSRSSSTRPKIGSGRRWQSSTASSKTSSKARAESKASSADRQLQNDAQERRRGRAKPDESPLGALELGSVAQRGKDVRRSSRPAHAMDWKGDDDRESCQAPRL